MKRTVLLVILGCLLSVVSICSAEDTKILVGVEVLTDDELLRDTVSSYIKRELRSLGDVKVGSEGDVCAYNIHISFPGPIKNTMTGQVVYHIFSADFTRINICNSDTGFNFFYEYLGSMTNWVSPSSLQESMKGVVAYFDSQYIEQGRQNIQGILRN